MSINKLLFRRQFILGPAGIERPGWKQVRLDHGFVLTAHRDLSIVQTRLPRSTLTLLGYILDAQHPLFDDSQILSDIHVDGDSVDNLVSRTDYFSGRWILIYTSDENSFLINDACGFRDLFFTSHKNNTWCASQPHLLAEYIPVSLSEDTDIVSYFAEENIRQMNYKWATDLSAYAGVYHLQPNHFLDLRKGQSRRFSLELEPNLKPMHSVIEENCNIMSNILIAASRRHKLMIACTAGYDSRVLLAASRKILNHTCFYIFRFNYMKDNHYDVITPAKMFKELNLPFNILDDMDQRDIDFEAAFQKNVMYPRKLVKPCLHYQYSNFPDFLNVSENTLPIAKVFFARMSGRNAIELARIYHQPPKQFILDWLQDWIDGAGQSVPEDRINLSDLYFWEVFLANACSAASTEQDIAIEDLSPSNCRRMIMNFFSVHSEYHTEKHSYAFHHKMIEKMWAELLKYKFNPDLKTNFHYLLRKNNLYFSLIKTRDCLKSLKSRISC